jgi:DNA-binding NarL/FixJ family response regulator
VPAEMKSFAAISLYKNPFDNNVNTSIARKVVNSLRLSEEQNTLSSREMEVLTLLSKGFLYKEIAAKLFISAGTVRQHIHNIYEKLHVQNRTEAINKIFNNRK